MFNKRLHHIPGCPQDVQQRSPLRDPPGRREQLLLAVDRQVKAILRRDDLGGDRGVVPIPLDQPHRSSRTGDSALGMPDTGELWQTLDPNVQLGGNIHEGFDHILADLLPSPVYAAT